MTVMTVKTKFPEKCQHKWWHRIIHLQKVHWRNAPEEMYNSVHTSLRISENKYPNFPNSGNLLKTGITGNVQWVINLAKQQQGSAQWQQNQWKDTSLYSSDLPSGHQVRVHDLPLRSLVQSSLTYLEVGLKTHARWRHYHIRTVGTCSQTLLM